MSLQQERQERRERFERVLRVVNYNSGYITPVVREALVRRLCVDQIGMDESFYESHLKGAVENDRLVRGSGYLWSPEYSGAYADAVEYVAENAPNPREFVAAMNEHKL